MVVKVQPKQTLYKGYRFRSRTEARWAVFFDAIGIRWEYEVEGYQGGNIPRGAYLPDFVLPDLGHTGGLIVEIKGYPPTPEELLKIIAVCEGLGQYGVLIAGTPGNEGLNVYQVSKEGLIASTDLMTALDISQKQYNKGVATARGARFEFGETPNVRQ